MCSTSLKVINISQNICDSTAANKIANILAKNTQLEELFLSNAILQGNSITTISLCLDTTILRVFDISNNDISSKAANDIAHVVSKQDKLEKLILSGNNLQDGLKIIVKNLKCYSTLKTLDISDNNASTTTIDYIAIILSFKSKLEKLHLGGDNSVSPKTLQTLQYFLALTAFDIPSTKISDEVDENVQRNVFRHMAHMQILLLEHDEDISANEYNIHKIHLPNTRLSLKLDKAKIYKSIGKCVFQYNI